MWPIPARKLPDVLPLQIRGARALLDWTRKDLATRSGLSERSIAILEEGERGLRPENVEKLVRALEAGGVEFYWTREGGPGLVLRPRERTEASAP